MDEAHYLLNQDTSEVKAKLQEIFEPSATIFYEYGLGVDIDISEITWILNTNEAIKSSKEIVQADVLPGVRALQLTIGDFIDHQMLIKNKRIIDQYNAKDQLHRFSTNLQQSVGRTIGPCQLDIADLESVRSECERYHKLVEICEKVLADSLED